MMDRINLGIICPYCDCETKLVKGDIIYPKVIDGDLRPKYLDKMYYQCINNPDHYVGTYSDNVKSLGRLADAELRKWKHQGHVVFDPLWKGKILFSQQKTAYEWLSNKMQLPIQETHFGMFTIEQCKRAISFCQELINE